MTQSTYNFTKTYLTQYKSLLMKVTSMSANLVATIIVADSQNIIIALTIEVKS